VSQVARELSRKPTLLFLCLAFAGVAFVDIGYVTWMPTFLQEKYAMSPASAGFSSMFYHHLGAFIGILLAGRVTDLWSRTRRVVRIEAQVLGCFCGAPFIYMMGMSDTPGMCYVGLGVFGIFRGVWESNLYASLFEVIAPRLRSSAVGVMICSAFLIGALSPLLLGAFKQKLGLGMGLASLSGVYVFAGLMLLSARLWTFRRDCIDEAPVATARV
jgi:sugar phosphate permease